MSRVQINTPPRGLDLNANPSGGARLYAYEAGTTTPVLIYGDPDLVTAVGYYLEADAAGAFPDAYLAPGFYKFTMTDADGATLPGWPVDRVEIGTAADVALTALAAIKTAANAILAPIRESLADFEADTILSYEDTDTTLQVVEGQAILLKDGHILTVLPSDSTLTPIYQNALPVPVKARLRGLDYPTLDALKLAISEGDDFAVGTTATAAGKPYRFDDDGNTALAGMTGWVDVYAERDAALSIGDPAGPTTPSRTAGVIYQNTWTRPRVVSVYKPDLPSGSTAVQFYVGTTAGNLTRVGISAFDSAGTSFVRHIPQGPYIVPAGWFYRLDGVFDTWIEY